MLALLFFYGLGLAQEASPERWMTCRARSVGGPVVIRMNGQAHATSIAIKYRGKSETFGIDEEGRLVDANNNFVEFVPTIRTAGERRFWSVSYYAGHINLRNVPELSHGIIPCREDGALTWEQLQRMYPPHNERVPRSSVR